MYNAGHAGSRLHFYEKAMQFKLFHKEARLEPINESENVSR